MTTQAKKKESPAAIIRRQRHLISDLQSQLAAQRSYECFMRGETVSIEPDFGFLAYLFDCYGMEPKLLQKWLVRAIRTDEARTAQLRQQGEHSHHVLSGLLARQHTDELIQAQCLLSILRQKNFRLLRY